MLDLILREARVVDGSGAPWFKGDVGVRDGFIVAIGDLSDRESKDEVDARGGVLAPGFIDIHTHSDVPLVVDGHAESHVRQGVTTAVIGNCGNSPAPTSTISAPHVSGQIRSEYPDLRWPEDPLSFGEYLEMLEEGGVSLNVVPLVGHGTLRMAAMGYEPGDPNPEQMKTMRDMLARSLSEGAFGFSSGLIYAPGSYAGIEELKGLARTTARMGGIYATHMRGENDTLFDALDEAIEIGEDAGLPVQISHLKVMGRHMWGESERLLATIDEARKRGIDITGDQYPYPASATNMAAYLPGWAHAGGSKELLRRLRDPGERARKRRDILEGVDGWVSVHRGVGWEHTLITKCNRPELEGRTVEEVALSRGTDPFETAFDLLSENEGNVGVVLFTIGDEDMERIMKHPFVMVASDSAALAVRGPLGRGKPHPRSFGTFVRVLGRYVREKGVLRLEEAVRKMTSMPAARLGLWDRGLIRCGMRADLVLFDAQTVADLSEYTDPLHYPAGVEAVYVNGRETVRDGEHLGVRAGEILRRN
ncbi:MAG: D-aminoacylase [Bacillota bacterium]